MDTNTKIQFYIFLTSFYGGLIAGFAYDIYRIIRHYSKPKKTMTIIEDFFFWVGIALIFFYILKKSNWGELRGYIFLAFIVGGLIYLKILSRFILPLLIKVFGKLGLFFKKIIYLLILPFRFIKKKLSPNVKKIKRISKIPKEAINEIKRYKTIISKKK